MTVPDVGCVQLQTCGAHRMGRGIGAGVGWGAAKTSGLDPWWAARTQQHPKEEKRGVTCGGHTASTVKLNDRALRWVWAGRRNMGAPNRSLQCAPKGLQYSTFPAPLRPRGYSEVGSGGATSASAATLLGLQTSVGQNPPGPQPAAAPSATELRHLRGAVLQDRDF